MKTIIYKPWGSLRKGDLIRLSNGTTLTYSYYKRTSLREVGLICLNELGEEWVIGIVAEEGVSLAVEVEVKRSKASESDLNNLITCISNINTFTFPEGLD